MILTLALCSRNARPKKGLVRRPHIDRHECPPKRRKTSESGRINSIGGGRLMRAGGDGTDSISTLTMQGYPIRVEQLEQTA